MAIVHRRSDGGPYSIMSNGCTVWQAAMKSPKDRKSTRLNSSHSQISYAVFCLKKKKKKGIERYYRQYKQTKDLPHNGRYPRDVRENHSEPEINESARCSEHDTL